MADLAYNESTHQLYIKPIELTIQKGPGPDYDNDSEDDNSDGNVGNAIE